MRTGRLNHREAPGTAWGWCLCDSEDSSPSGHPPVRHGLFTCLSSPRGQFIAVGTEAQTGPVKIPVGPCPALVVVIHSRPSGGLLGGGVVRDGAAPGPDAMSHLGSARQGHRRSSRGVLWAFGEGLLSPALPVVTWGPPGAELGPWHWRIGRLHQLGVWALACNPTLLNITDGDLQSFLLSHPPSYHRGGN